MRPIVMGLDMIEITRIFECGNIPIQLAHPQVNCRIPVANGAQVALEVSNINWVKAYLSHDVSRGAFGRMRM